MTIKRALPVTLVSLLLIFMGFTAGFYTQTWFRKDRSQFPILDQAYQILSNHSLQELPEAPALEYGMIRGLLQASGDPYAVFLEPILHELETDSLEGNFGGIGVELVRAENGDLLLYPYPESPAAVAGVRAGDQLLTVDGMAITSEMPIETIQAAIRGGIDETVRITVSRKPGRTPLDFEIARKEMPLPSITWRVHPESPSLGIIKLNVIASSTLEEILHAVDELKDLGASGYILDLRDNGGGLLSESIEITRLFLARGEILEQQYRGQPVDSYSVEEPGLLKDLDMVVLVNENTASAAEIIAGALKANDRAPIIGTPTLGKDSIQLVFDLDDGSSLHITAARWWVPGLEPPIGDHGVQPDITIPADVQGADPALKAAVDLLSHGR